MSRSAPIKHSILFRLFVNLMFVAAFAVAANAQTTAFSYQGHLSDASIAANGTYQMQFALWNAVSGGAQQGATITNTSVSVVNGIFTVQLDLGSTPFAAGADRWIEIAVKKPAEAGYTTLTPRQQIASSPYSIRTLSASTADGLSAACVGCVGDTQLSSNVVLMNASQTLTNKTIDSTTNTVTTDKLRTATGTVDVKSSAAPSSGQVLTATGPTAATWQSPSATSWAVGGNSLGATGTFGTTSNNHLDLKTNNLIRGRFSSLGEFFFGTTAPVVSGDLMAVQANATFPWAIAGYTAQNGAGVYGQVISGTSIFGAVQGEYKGTGTGTGVYGQYVGSASGNPSPTGVIGYSSPTVSGNQRIGVRGFYNPVQYGIGVAGIGFGGSLPPGNNDIGVVGWVGNNANYSGYFNGNHVIANGTKSASVGTSQGNQLLYATESPEVWFEDIGSGKLVNGEALITLDKMFLETVQIDEKHPMHVFIQMEDDSEEVFVKKGTTSFVVKERKKGTSNASFSYRIVAKRLNFQDHRFGNDPVWGAGDTRKYSQYATPPPVDYKENLKFQADQRLNWKPTPMPEGFKLVQDGKDPLPATRQIKP